MDSYKNYTEKDIQSLMKLNEVIVRKDDLLRKALGWLKACEWEVPLSIIVAIEKELERKE